MRRIKNTYSIFTELWYCDLVCNIYEVDWGENETLGMWSASWLQASILFGQQSNDFNSYRKIWCYRGELSMCNYLCIAKSLNQSGISIIVCILSSIQFYIYFIFLKILHFVWSILCPKSFYCAKFFNFRNTY